VEVVTNERLCKQHGIIAATQKHEVVRMNEVEIVAQVLHSLFAVDVERYLQEDSKDSV